MMRSLLGDDPEISGQKGSSLAKDISMGFRFENDGYLDTFYDDIVEALGWAEGLVYRDPELTQDLCASLQRTLDAPTYLESVSSALDAVDIMFSSLRKSKALFVHHQTLALYAGSLRGYALKGQGDPDLHQKHLSLLTGRALEKYLELYSF